MAPRRYYLPWTCIVCRKKGKALFDEQDMTCPIVTDPPNDATRTFFRSLTTTLMESHRQESPDCLASKDPEEALRRVGGSVLRFLNLGDREYLDDQTGNSPR